MLIDVHDGQLLVVQEEAVGGVVHEGTKPCLTRPELLFHAPQLGHILQGAEQAHGAACVVPFDLTATVDHPQHAVGAHQAVLDVVAPSASQSARGRLQGSRPVFRMYELEPVLLPPVLHVGLRQAEDAAHLVRKVYAVREQVPLPPAYMGDAFGLLQPCLALSQTAQHGQDDHSVTQPQTYFPEQAYLVGGPGLRARALTQHEEVVALLELGM